MPVTPDAINEALQSGYSPDQIIQHIQTKYPEYKDRLDEATRSGYSASEIVDHLKAKGFTQPTNQNAVLEQPGASQSQSSRSTLDPQLQRAQMGLPLRTRTGQIINEIRPSEERLSQADKIIKQTQAAPSTPDPNKGLLGAAGWFTGLPQLARSAEMAGKEGKITPGLMANTFMSLPMGRQAQLLGKIPGVSAAGKLLRNLPIIKPAAERLGARLNAWAYNVPKLSHELLSRQAAHEADTHAAYMEVQQLGEELGKSGLNDAQKEKIYDAYVHGGKGLDTLDEHEKAFLDKLLPIKDALTKSDLKEGVIKESRDWYMTQLYKGGKAKKFLSSIMKTAPTALKKTFANPTELAEAQQKISSELEAKGLTVDQALNKSDAELKDLGFNPKIKHTLSLEPIKDPIKAVQAQMLASRMAQATKRNVMELADMSNEYGEKLIDHVPGPDRVKLNSPIFNKWAISSVKSGDTRLTRFLEKDAYVLKKYAGNVQRLLNTNTEYPTWLRELREINRATKFLRFFNPAVHNVNETFGALQYFGFNVFKVLGLPGKAIAKDPNRLAEAVADGFETQRNYELKNGIAKDLDIVLNRYKSQIPYLTDTMDLIQRKVSNPMLWNHVDHIGLTIWDAAKQKFIAQGMRPDEAGKAAVTFAHDVIGKMTSYNAMAMFKNPYVNAMFNFIPSWVNSSLRKYIGAIAPGQAFQHLPEAARKALQVEYQHNLIHGVTIGNLVAQRLNYALSGHSTFENLPENRPSVTRPFGKIEMNLGGKLYSVDAPIMGSLTLPPRLLASIYNIGRGKPQGAMGFLQPTVSTPLTFAMEAYRTKDPMQAADKASEQISPLIPMATHTGAAIMRKGSLKEGLESGVSKTFPGELAINSVLPFRLQQADPRTDAVKKLWTLYKNDNKFEIISQQEPWKNDVDQAIQAKQFDKAGQIIRMHYTGSNPHQFFEHRMLKNTKPNTYTYLMIPTNKRSKYLQQLSPDEMERFKSAIKMEATPQE